MFDRSVFRLCFVTCFVVLLLAPLSARSGADFPSTSVRVSGSGSGGASIEELDIELGYSTSVRADFAVRRIAVGDPDVVDVLVLAEAEVLLVPVATGSTNVVLWGGSQAPEVVLDVSVGPSFSSLERRVASLLGSEDLSIKHLGDAVAIEGSVPDAVAADNAVRLVRAALSLPEEKKGALEIVNLLRVKGQQQVLLHVKIAEVSRSLDRQFGTNFNGLFDTKGGAIRVTGLVGDLAQASGTGGIAPSEFANLVGNLTGFGALESLELVMSALRRKGLAKVLAEPVLVARSGEDASFLVGGEIPIPVAQGGAAAGAITVEYKKFGVGLSFTPTVLSGERIHLLVNPEVSEPDFSIGANVGGTAVPGFNTRRASTGVELGNGESFAIAGLFRDDLRELSSAYPGLGEVPVLGALFRSSRYEQRETELVIIVTPSLVSALPEGQEFRLPTDSIRPPSAAEFYLLGRIEDWGSVDESSDQDITVDWKNREVRVPKCRAPVPGTNGECGTSTTWVSETSDRDEEQSDQQLSGFIGHVGYELPTPKRSMDEGGS